MRRADESLIRDADLKAQAESARGGSGFEMTIKALVATQKKRDLEATKKSLRHAELKALPRDKRRRRVIREVIETKPPVSADLRHIHSVLALCGLPYDRQPLDVREYERKQGNMAIDVQAGFLRDPKGKKILQPLPFGPKARLILMHLCSEAIRQKSETIEIADTFTGFVRDMGFSDSGGKKGPLTAFKQQLNALAACTIRISAWSGERSRMKTFVPLEDVDLWLSDNPDQRSLWPSTVTFSHAMFENLQRHALPVNAQVVRAFAGSARKLDLYFWLGWRMYSLQEPLEIGWEALTAQFGQGFVRQRAFKGKFAQEIDHIKEILPKAPLTLTETGLRLEPADPSDLALPARRLIKHNTLI
jgi:hypothetical protein